jgi:hypothetical protein
MHIFVIGEERRRAARDVGRFICNLKHYWNAAANFDAVQGIYYLRWKGKKIAAGTSGARYVSPNAN